MEIPIHFPWDGVYHRIQWKHPYFGKITGTYFLGFPHIMGFAAFSLAMGRENHCISHVITIPQNWKLMKEKSHTFGKVWVTIFRAPLLELVLLYLPKLWKIDGKTHVFPV